MNTDLLHSQLDFIGLAAFQRQRLTPMVNQFYELRCLPFTTLPLCFADWKLRHSTQQFLLITELSTIVFPEEVMRTRMQELWIPPWKCRGERVHFSWLNAKWSNLQVLEYHHTRFIVKTRLRDSDFYIAYLNFFIDSSKREIDSLWDKIRKVIDGIAISKTSRNF